MTDTSFFKFYQLSIGFWGLQKILTILKVGKALKLGTTDYYHSINLQISFSISYLTDIW